MRVNRSRTVLALGLALIFGLGACTSHESAGPTPSTSPSMAVTSGLADIGGYRLKWTCQGEGSPTIVTEAGYDSSGISTYADVLPSLAGISRVCAYDRAGTGLSDRRPSGMHVTSMLAAEELRTLLHEASIAEPYVVVAHSYGGFIGRLFSAEYPAQTAGLVLVDSSHEDEIGPYRRYYGSSPEGDWVDGGNLIDINATRRALRTTARDYGDLPLGVLKAGNYEDVLSTALWNRTQADLATLTTNSVLVQAQGGHFVMDDDPEVLVALVRAVVESARTGEALPSCDEIVDGTDGQCP